MRNSHVTHIAVNLSLIVALALQPVAVCMANVDCAADCPTASAFKCQGCGCCQVERADDRCCCGAGQGKNDSQTDTGCRGHASDAAPADETDTAAAANSLSVTTLVAIAEDRSLRSICLCEQGALPLSDSSPRRPTSENRNTVLTVWTDIADWGCRAGTQAAAMRFADGLPLPSHHFQVMLCIWRL
jgi:hypothetical protein